LLEGSHHQKPFINSINCLRGIAAFAVVVFHSRFVFPKASLQYSVLCHFAIGVQVFFIISGFILMYAMQRSSYNIAHYPRFILRRLIRIEPLYIIALLLAVAQTFYHAEYYNKCDYDMEWARFFSHFAYLTKMLNYKWWLATFWTLAIEFQFYILVGLIAPLLLHRNYTYAILASAGLYFSRNISNNDMWLFHHIQFFVMGIVLFQIQEKIIPKKWGFLALVLMLLNAYSVEFKWVTAIVCAISIIVIYTDVLSNYVLHWLGNISYPLYLTHNLFTIELWKVIEKNKPEILHKTITLPFIFTLLSVIMAYILHVSAEKYFIKLSKKVKYN